ncbi:MAG: zinc-ribbon domain containing protein [Candidatus Eremiobacteraeota bacterium]|nr:zinc-ribbon domain containing protein [Candidatus Eremiobacteraeota bacterium]MCW5868855.1 zinc-ribbon domain containing protein [Candidatus Eremiobacteraeota bacterium]
MAYTDMTLTCTDCNQSFTFTSGEQEFHAQKGFSNRPSRCPSCRAARKASGGGGGRSGGGGFGGGFGGGGGSRQMHPATCAQCGKETEVPFVPSGNRPVYCRDCFSSQSGGSRGGGGGGRGGRR